MKKYYYIFLVVLITACSKNYIFNNEFKPGEKLNNLLTKYAGINKFEDLFVYKGAIALEFKPESIIGSVQKILMLKDKIYILETYAPDILCFQSDGRYSFKVGRKGSGPGEYIRPLSMDAMNDILYVYDQPNLKVIKYNAIDGKYINEYKLNYRYDKILTQEEKIYFYRAIAEQYVYKKSAIDVYDENFEYLASIELGVPDKPEKFIFLPGLNFGFVKNNKEGIYYVNQCDLLLRYIDTQAKKIRYGANELPKSVKLNDPPAQSTFENMKNFSNDNSILYGLFYFNNGLVVEHMDKLFALYDNTGNFISKIDVELKIYHSDSEFLYILEQPSKNGNNSNGKIIRYELKK